MRAANSEAEATNQTEPRCTSTTVKIAAVRSRSGLRPALEGCSSVRARRGSESGEQRSLADRPTRPLAWEEAGSADDWDDLEAAGRRNSHQPQGSVQPGPAIGRPYSRKVQQPGCTTGDQQARPGT